MGRHARRFKYVPLPTIIPGELTIPNDFITSEMIKSNAILGHHIKDQVITLDKLDSFLIEELHSLFDTPPFPIDSDDIKPGAIDFSHLSENTRNYMSFPKFDDISANEGIIELSKNMGKTFLGFGEIPNHLDAIFLTLTLIPPTGSSSGATLKVYGGGVYNQVTKIHTNGVAEAIVNAGRHIALTNGFNIPVFGELSLVHNPVQGEEYLGIVLEITAADDPAKLFRVEVRPYGWLDNPSSFPPHVVP